MMQCRTTGNQVAVKLYHKNKLSELNFFQVSREIRIHSSLDHKNIIQLVRGVKERAAAGGRAWAGGGASWGLAQLGVWGASGGAARGGRSMGVPQGRSGARAAPGRWGAPGRGGL